jgi:DNA mismatch repair protein MutL
VVKNYALGSPSVTFILRIDGRDTIYLDNSLSAEQRLANIIHYQGPFIPIETGRRTNNTYNMPQVSGFLVPPEKVTTGPAKMRIFVNGRAIRDRMIIHAVTEGLRGFLMKGKNPSGLIHLVLPPAEVDVNVHPAKHEVRFRNARDVHTVLSQAVAKAMLEQQKVMKASLFGPEQTMARTAVPLEAAEDLTAAYAAQRVSSRQSNDDFHANREQQPTQENSKHMAEPSTKKSFTATIPSIIPQAAGHQPLLATAEPIEQSSSAQTSVPKNRETPHQEQKTVRHNLLVVGQYDDLYIFCKNSDGLLVIDQHAAHERLLYEKLHRQYLAKTVARQILMFPETVELSLFQAQLVEKNEAAIDRLGFTVREFGGNTYIISAIPALAGTSNPRELFLDILEQFGSEQNRGSGGGFLDTILATMACRAAVKAGTTLSTREIDTLLNEMARADLFSHCPHGRPVVKQFTREEVKKWFYRN